MFLITQGYKWVSVRLDDDIVFENVFETPWQPRAAYSPGSWERLQDYYWPNEKGTKVKRIDMLLQIIINIINNIAVTQ